MAEITWEEPPDPQPLRSRAVMALLDTRPGAWARIDGPGRAQLFSWWAAINNDPDYEVRVVRHDTDLFGERSIYARRRA